jgi:hypothetical protein
MYGKGIKNRFMKKDERCLWNNNIGLKRRGPEDKLGPSIHQSII